MANAEDLLANFYRGDTKRYTLRFKQADGSPIDLTGATVWFTMKAKKTDEDRKAAIQKKVQDHTDAVNGVTIIQLDARETATLVPKVSYYYDFQLVDSAGRVSTILTGSVRVLEDITLSTD